VHVRQYVDVSIHSVHRVVPPARMPLHIVSMVFHMFLFRAVGSRAAGAAWAAPRLKAREAWSLTLYVHANVHRSKIGPYFSMLCVATLSTAAGSLFDQ